MTSCKKVFMGIDYSMTSPAIAIWDSSKVFSFDNCHLAALSTSKKIEGDVRDNIKIHLNDYNKDSNENRFDMISEWVMSYKIKYNVSDVFIEGYAYGAKGQLFNIGENTGLLKHKLFKSSCSITVIPPTVVKKQATGKGIANKEKMGEAFTEETSIDMKFVCGQTEKQWNPSSDLIDAYYILKTGLLQNEII